MLYKVKLIFLLIKNMGLKFVLYRAFYELKRKTGLLKIYYPTKYKIKEFIKLNDWKSSSPDFFFNSRESLPPFNLDNNSIQRLEEEVNNIVSGRIKFFGSYWLDLGIKYDWVTHPETGHHFPSDSLWFKIENYDAQAGDIKYVWEKSRFSWIHTIIRYDHHSGKDHSQYLFNTIEDWINKNKLNCGPNYICSQEISLRVLNWIYCLYFYKNSNHLSEQLFQKIINSIYWQIRHVASNINFSLSFVRNNHAITECLLLYLSQFLFPFFIESPKWGKKGERNLEKETLFQIFDDGSYLQYTMNYHRVIIQLYSWCFYLSEIHNHKLNDSIYKRVRKSLDYLYENQNITDGKLPNYGLNDGALFFPLNNCDFQDFRPQINGLYYYFTKSSLYSNGIWNEDIFWFSGNPKPVIKKVSQKKLLRCTTGGYYTIRKDEGTFIFIRCGNHLSRPAQADNLHLDLWYQGENILIDGGMYKYNTSTELIKYFWGTKSHNTIMIGKNDQMEKGDRFIWKNWTKCLKAELDDNITNIRFEGLINAFGHVGKNILHKRTVVCDPEFEKIIVEDCILGTSEEAILLWHKNPLLLKINFDITVFDKDGKIIEPTISEGFRALYYGTLQNVNQLEFRAKENIFKTIIQLIKD